MMASPKFTDFLQRYQSLKLQQDTNDRLLQDVLIYCQEVEKKYTDENQRLTEQLRDVELDLAATTGSRRTLQQQLQDFERKVDRVSQENDILKNRNPYVLILIDGDGLIFQEHLVKQGLEGGKKAAYGLRAAIAVQCGEHADEVEIVAKVVANIAGLGKAMLRDGCLDNAADLKDFTLGFTQAKASFDFIDVGYGKERADSKIKEATRWNLRNHNCKQILLGISHDAGYAPFLDETLRDETTRQSITILEGFPTVRELVATGVHILDVGQDLFRKDKLLDRSASVPQLSSAPPALTPTLSNASATTPPTTSSSYAIITSASPPPQMKIPLAPKPQTKSVAAIRQKTPQPSWNPGPRGLDDPVMASPQALESVKRRKENNKLCNNHYLRGPCSRRDVCQFEHHYRPTPDEINAIALLSRLNPCTSGQDCDVDGCIYGHHCPSVKDGICGHPYCKFAIEAHPPGTKFKNPNIRDN